MYHWHVKYNLLPVPSLTGETRCRRGDQSSRGRDSGVMTVLLAMRGEQHPASHAPHRECLPACLHACARARATGTRDLVSSRDHVIARSDRSECARARARPSAIELAALSSFSGGELSSRPRRNRQRNIVIGGGGGEARREPDRSSEARGRDQTLARPRRFIGFSITVNPREASRGVERRRDSERRSRERNAAEDERERERDVFAPPRGPLRALSLCRGEARRTIVKYRSGVI